MFSSYIDRQKSRVGSSEKSQKVHSANWKEEVQLRKELFCLNKQERQRVSRISIEQRLVVNRFQKKLSKSVEISKSHEQVVNTLKGNRATMIEQALNRELEAPSEHMRTIRCLNAFPKPPVPKFNERRSKSCEPSTKPKENESILINEECKKEEKSELIPRPMTALEKRNKLWERQLSSVTQRINRARSAPTKATFYKVPEFTAGTTKLGKRTIKTANRQPGMSYAVDMDLYRYVREKEIAKQNEAVQDYLKGIEGLELVPWTPFDYVLDESNASTEIRRTSRTRKQTSTPAFTIGPVNAWT